MKWVGRRGRGNNPFLVEFCIILVEFSEKIKCIYVAHAASGP